jgi:hypothetical protein
VRRMGWWRGALLGLAVVGPAATSWSANAEQAPKSPKNSTPAHTESGATVLVPRSFPHVL